MSVHPRSRVGARTNRRYLIYFCVFTDAQYLELLTLSLITLRLFSDMRDVDIWVLSAPSFARAIRRIGAACDVALRTVVAPWDTPFEAASARLRIFEEKRVLGYDKVMYMDADVLIKGDIRGLFEQDVQERRIYGIEEGTLGSDNFGGELFRHDGKPFDPAAPGLNSGILLFRPGDEVRVVFETALKMIREWHEAGREPPPCLDQPFVSYCVTRSGCVGSPVLMRTWAGIFDECIPAHHEEVAMCHFSWPLGDCEHKLRRMRDYLDYMIKYWVPDNALRLRSAWNGRRWRWKHGWFECHPDGRLVASWETTVCGYHCVRADVIRAMWDGHVHLVRLCEEDGSIYHVRSTDFACGTAISPR